MNHPADDEEAGEPYFSSSLLLKYLRPFPCALIPGRTMLASGTRHLPRTSRIADMRHSWRFDIEGFPSVLKRSKAARPKSCRRQRACAVMSSEHSWEHGVAQVYKYMPWVLTKLRKRLTPRHQLSEERCKYELLVRVGSPSGAQLHARLTLACWPASRTRRHPARSSWRRHERYHSLIIAGALVSKEGSRSMEGTTITHHASIATTAVHRKPSSKPKR